MATKAENRAGVTVSTLGALTREMPLEGDHQFEEFAIKGVAIATERAVVRSFGEERLVISDESIVSEDTIPLLAEHNPQKQSLGWATNLRVVDKVLRADIVFDRDYDKARKMYESVVKGNRHDLSIGYITLEASMKTLGASLAESYTVSKFNLCDVSVVGRGADSGAGFYRSAEDVGNILTDESIPETMTKPAGDNKPEDKADQAEPVEKIKTRAASAPVAEPKPKVETRASAIDLMELGDEYGIEQSTIKGWVRDGVTLTAAKDNVLAALKKRSAADVPVRFTDAAPKEDQTKYQDGKVKYSMRGAIDFLVSNQLGDGNFSAEASLARDVSKDLGGGTGQKLRVPYEALNTRAFEASATKQGAKLITDEVRMSEFQKFLYANTVSGKLGLKTLTGLTDNVVIPVQTKSISASYVSEGSAGSSVDMEATNIKLSPSTAIALTKVTNLARAQMPGIQSILQDDLLNQLRLAVDRTTLIGGGSNEPTGIMATSGVTIARTGSSNAASRKFKLEEILTLVGKIQNANVMGNLKIVTEPNVINAWRKEKDTDGQYLWSANTDMTTVMDVPGYLWGIPVYASTNLRNSGDAVTDHRLIIGVFDYGYQAFWGNSFNLEIGTTGSDFASDTASIRAVVYHSAAVARAAAFEGVSKIEV